MSTLESESSFDTTGSESVEPITDAPLQTAAPSESADTESEGDSTSLSEDVIFDILKNQRRRSVLGYVRERGTSTLSDVAEHVAALEQDKDVRNLTSSERKRVYVGLYQCHLPRMDDADVIDFNRARGTIELLESTDQLFPYLDLDPSGHTSGTGAGLERAREWLGSLSSLLGR